MPKYRKKPIIINAIKLDFITTSNLTFEFMGKQFESSHFSFRNEDGSFDLFVEIETLEGNMKAMIGDYLICGIKGEFYPCKPDIFEDSYELVSEETNEN